MALEEAGELQEAARVFEYAGEHAQAATLRLEHAKTLRDPDERLDVLREGCARNPGTTTEGRRLHLALGEALLDEAGATTDSARRRTLELEAARAFEEAEEGVRAGELYESLGMLRRAANAYERTGEIARLELVLEVLERQEQREQADRDREREVDEALVHGRRRDAYELLQDHVQEAKAHGRAPKAGVLQQLHNLETRLIRRDRVEFQWGSGHVTCYRGGSRFVIGRAPDADLTLAGAALSRHHVELRVAATGERPELVAVDLGSKVGTFWDGDALEPGEPMVIASAGVLGLGGAASVEIHPLGSPEGGAVGGLVCVGDRRRWLVFLPGGGPLWLAPEIKIPARLLFDRGYVVLDLHPKIAAQLDSTLLPLGANLELMVGDRITLVDVPLTLEVLQ